MLAGRLDVSNGAVGEWETSGKIPRGDTLVKIAALLDTSAAYLITGELGSTSTPRINREKELQALARSMGTMRHELAKAERLVEDLLGACPNSGLPSENVDTARRIGAALRRDVERHRTEAREKTEGAPT